MRTIQYNVFVFLRVAFSNFICKSGYMYEQEQSEEKYIYYTFYSFIFTAAIHSSCSLIIFPLDNVSDYVSLNYICDRICITFYISIELLKHVMLSK